MVPRGRGVDPGRTPLLPAGSSPVPNGLPFYAVPSLPLEPMSWTPLVILTLVAGVLVRKGLARFARRDVQVG